MRDDVVFFSVLDLSPIVRGSTAAEALRNTVDLAQNAERWGYFRYWLAEHRPQPSDAGSLRPAGRLHASDDVTIAVALRKFAARDSSADLETKKQSPPKASVAASALAAAGAHLGPVREPVTRADSDSERRPFAAQTARVTLGDVGKAYAPTLLAIAKRASALPPCDPWEYEPCVYDEVAASAAQVGDAALPPLEVESRGGDVLQSPAAVGRIDAVRAITDRSRRHS
jgi:hypothetical protein